MRFVKTLGVPLLVTGGGGYTKQNVARCWAYETGVLVDRPMREDIPVHDHYCARGRHMHAYPFRPLSPPPLLPSLLLSPLHPTFFADEYYADAKYKLKVHPVLTLENANSRTRLASLRASVLENLRALEHAPCVQMAVMPPDRLLPDLADEDADPEARGDDDGAPAAGGPVREDEWYDGAGA